jgi:signal transduction histidine kinase
MRYWISTIILGLHTLTTYCQTATPAQIPELEAKAKTLSDSSALMALYNELAFAYLRNDINKCFEYANAALGLSIKYNDPAEKIKALHQMGEYHLAKNSPDASKKMFEDSENISKQLDDKSLFATTLQKMGKWNQINKNNSQAIHYYNESIKVRESIGDIKGTSGIYHNLLVMYSEANDFARAYEYGETAMRLRKQYGNDREISTTRNSFAILLMRMGKLDQALPLLNESLEATTRMNDKAGIWQSLTNLGNVHLEKAEYDRALDYFQKAQPIGEELKKEYNNASNHYYIAKCLMHMGKYKEASDFALKVIDYCKKNINPNTNQLYVNGCEILIIIHKNYGNKNADIWFDQLMQLSPGDYNRGMAHFNYAGVWETRKDYSKMLYHSHKAYLLRNHFDNVNKVLAEAQYGISLSRNGKILEALPILETSKKALGLMNANTEIVRITSEIAHILSQHKDASQKEKALKLALDNVKKAQKSENAPDLQNAYRQLSIVYESMNNKTEALKYLQLSNKIKDSLLTFTDLSEISQTEWSMHLQDSLNHVNKDVEVSKSSLTTEKGKSNLLMIFVCALIILIPLAYYGYSTYAKKQIVLKEEHLRKEMAEKELRFLLERKRISQDLHDEVGSTLSSISIMSYSAMQQLEGLIKTHELEAIGERAREATQSISDIIWAVNPQNDHISKMIQRVKGYGEDTLQYAGINFELNQKDVDNIHLSTEVRKEILMIIKELINNCAKYSKATLATLTIEKNADLCSIMFSDNGIGYDPSVSNTGNGLPNIHERCAKIKGILRLDTQRGKGTTYYLDIPLKI